MFGQVVCFAIFVLMISDLEKFFELVVDRRAAEANLFMA